MNVQDVPKSEAMKSNENDKFRSNPGGGKLASGEPDADESCKSGSEEGVWKRAKAARHAPILQIGWSHAADYSGAGDPG